MNKNELKSILKSINTIAVIGASSNPVRDSNKVMNYLIKKGYEVFPVNPNETNNKILGRKCYSNLKDINKKIDMVDIFRAREFVMEIAKDAIQVGVDVFWTQEGIEDKKSATMIEQAGIISVMNKCPMKVLENKLDC